MHGVIHIHSIDLTTPFEPGAADFLTETEIQRASSFRFPDDAERWITCRAGLRRILSHCLGISPLEVPITTNEFGKPELDGIANPPGFNLSHCRELALIAIRRGGRVGVDVEPLKRAPDLLECESSFCHPEEIASLPLGGARAEALLDLWTAKEALLKALGTGLSTAPESLWIRRADGSLESSGSPSLEGLRVIRLEAPWLAGYRAALATDGGDFRIEHHRQP